MTTSSLHPEFNPPASQEAPHHSHSKIDVGEIAVGVVIGRASEYFDYFVYGIASALVFPAVFFPFEKGLEGTLLSFLIFSFAFISRPLGTVIFMAIQKRYGREAKLTSALFLLGISTAFIAFLPGYASLGMSAIVLLSVFRLVQGIALGGTWDGLPSLLAMHAPEKRRGWYAALAQLGAPVGFMIASALFSFLYASLSLDEFLDWGWRYTFYVAFAINVVALFARLRLVTTKEYSDLLDANELEPTNVGELAKKARPDCADRRLRISGKLRIVSSGHRISAVLDSALFNPIYQRIFAGSDGWSGSGGVWRRGVWRHRRPRWTAQHIGNLCHLDRRIQWFCSHFAGWRHSGPRRVHFGGLRFARPVLWPICWCRELQF